MGNFCTKRRRDRSSPHVLCDDTLILIFNEMSPRDLIPLQTVSKQFEECIEESLRQRKCFSVFRSEEVFRRYPLDPGHLCMRRHQNHPKDNDYFLNDLRPVVSHWANVFQFNQSLSPLKSFTRNCTQISSLTLQTCAIDEEVIKYFNENLKNLKCLVLIDCRLYSFNELVSSDQMKHLSKNLIHLRIQAFHEYMIEDNEVLTFIRLFPNLVDLMVSFKSPLSVENLFEELTPSVKSIVVESDLVLIHHIPDHLIARLSHVKRLDLWLRISIETMETIITSLNLKKLMIRCLELSSAFMQKMAKYQKQLKVLRFYVSQFIEFNESKRKVIFENVRTLAFNRPKLSPFYFKQIIEMFPNLRKLFFYPSKRYIECEDNPPNNECETCCYKTFEVIPRLESLKSFGTYLRFTGRQLFECLDRFPNLSYLKMSCRHIFNDQNHDQNDTYNQGKLKDIMDYLFRICEKNPQKLIKFELRCDERPFPSDIKRPRNLKIIYLYQFNI